MRIEDGVAYLSSAEAADHNLNTQVVEFWRLELFLGIQDPEGFSKALTIVEPKALFFTLERMEKAIAAEIISPGSVLPLPLHDDFLDMAHDLRRRLLEEGARRGINIVAHPDAHRQH